MIHANHCSATALALGLLLLAPASGAVMIDDFADGALQIVTASNTVNAQHTESAGQIIGVLGDREETIVNTGAGTIFGGEVTPDRWTYSATGTTGNATLVWDGAGGAFPGLDLGLGGVDLTESGLHDALAISIVSNDISTNLTFTVYTDLTNFSTLTLATAGAPGTLLGLYTSFVDDPGGTGADFTNVNAISLLIDGNSPTLDNMDMTFELFETTNSIGVPEPGTAAMLGLGLVLLAYTGRPRPRA